MHVSILGIDVLCVTAERESEYCAKHRGQPDLFPCTLLEHCCYVALFSPKAFGDIVRLPHPHPPVMYARYSLKGHKLGS